MSKFRSHYPNWSITKSLKQIYGELVGGVIVKSRRSIVGADGWV